jgi:[CysO sulfur-carrier protein]-S-L-cysteine hydrolase
MLKIKRTDLEKIHRQATDEYPDECCGILTLAAEASIVEVHPCRNIQEQLHAEDPQRFPRPARTAYYIDPQELFQIVSGAEKAGGRIAAFYHSHIDCDAYFSDEDKERAMIWGEPAYPEASYPVFSVYDGQVKGFKCFAWDEAKRDFVEVNIEVVD